MNIDKIYMKTLILINDLILKEQTPLKRRFYKDKKAKIIERIDKTELFLLEEIESLKLKKEQAE